MTKERKVCWTKLLEDKLTVAWMIGLPVKEICREIGLEPSCKNAVIGKAHRLGLSKHVNTPKNIDPVKVAMKNALKKNRPARPEAAEPFPADLGPRWTDERKARLTSMWLADAKLHTMAGEFRCSTAAVSEQAKKMGLPSRYPQRERRFAERQTLQQGSCIFPGCHAHAISKLTCYEHAYIRAEHGIPPTHRPSSQASTVSV